MVESSFCSLFIIIEHRYIGTGLSCGVEFSYSGQVLYDWWGISVSGNPTSFYHIGRHSSSKGPYMGRYDYVIVGSGIAGLYAALLAKQHGNVLIITKGRLDDCNSMHAQGGIAAAVDKSDSPKLHHRDTIEAGAGLSNPETVRILTEEGPKRIADLIEVGVPFDTVDGQVALTREAAHSAPRILHAGGDATGQHIETTLRNKVHSAGIQILEDCLATEILVDSREVRGVRALDCHTGLSEEFECHFLILATGGAGRLFKFNTNSDIATGDGVSLAFRAGAQISDIEFYQFHPTALRLPGVPPFLLSEAMRGEGGILRNVEGHRFILDYTPKGELAPRDVVARSIVEEMKKGHSERVFLDVTHLPPYQVTTRFPNIYQFCLEHGLDITRGLIPVAPAAHYMMGGVRTNTWGETNIKGLYAAGEVACTGVHGANRLASNSMLEVVVFSKRIIERTSQEYIGPAQTELTKVEEIHHVPTRGATRSAAPISLSALQNMMWENVGIVRSEETLKEAADVLSMWQQGIGPSSDRLSYELSNLTLVARLITEAALIRKESRGAHFRSDFPDTSTSWIKHIILERE
ncbi:MAG: L-aspartate oxidase [Chloroflexota bacterium]|nr:L-aspartate oxidase [Chloroflexota bacterium]